MPTIIMSKLASRLDASMKKKAFAFLEKLGEDDTLPGLHIEPIVNAADDRVRTGRIDDGYRAVLFRLTAGGATQYVIHGIWNHDEANQIAETVTLTTNPVTGITEIHTVEAAAAKPVPVSPSPTAPVVASPSTSLLAAYGISVTDLLEKVGLSPTFASRAMELTDEAQAATLLDDAPADWQGLALIDLCSGVGIDDVRESLGLTQPPADTAGRHDDDAVIAGMQHPAGQLSFSWIDSTDELRRAVEGGDFGAWRVFLHPQQRRIVDRTYSGSARITGGAGTGKTVVLLHRARALAKRSPDSRIVLTTFTTNLADALKEDLRTLDPTAPTASALGQSGVLIQGVDSLVSAILRDAGTDVAGAVEAVLGISSSQVTGRTPASAWQDALLARGAGLPENLRSPAFMAAEYGAVVLPQRVTTRDEYFKARRGGRGVALDRGKRAVVWEVIAAYRAGARTNGTIDFVEASAVAAEYLDQRAAAGDRRYADHVLVDEGQDLSALHWQLLRAMVPEGPDDLFIAEDGHQRIYGQRLSLSQFGIHIVGRSRRLRLNYRTTEQNLRWGVRVLSGESFTDLDGAVEPLEGDQSARSGPDPVTLPAGSLSDELDAAANLLQAWLKERDVVPETVAVLVRDRFQRDRVVAGLGERGVEIRAIERGTVKPGLPVVMTMHRSKGTEFARVLLFGVRDGAIPAALAAEDYSQESKDDALRRERALLYVAATRARDVLAVSWSGEPSPFLTGEHNLSEDAPAG